MYSETFLLFRSADNHYHLRGCTVRVCSRFSAAFDCLLPAICGCALLGSTWRKAALWLVRCELNLLRLSKPLTNRTPVLWRRRVLLGLPPIGKYTIRPWWIVGNAGHQRKKKVFSVNTISVVSPAYKSYKSSLGSEQNRLWE